MANEPIDLDFVAALTAAMKTPPAEISAETMHKLSVAAVPAFLSGGTYAVAMLLLEETVVKPLVENIQREILARASRRDDAGPGNPPPITKG